MPSSSNSTVSRTRLPSVVVEHGNAERGLGVAVDDLPDHVGGLVAVERRAEHLQLVVGLGRRQLAVEVLEQGLQEEVDVALEVRERTAPAEIGEDLEQRRPQPAFVGVVAPVDGRLGLDVLGRDRGPHEREVVVDVRPLQHPRDDRVEERLGELGPLVVDEEADVEQLRAAPDRIVERPRVELRHAGARRIPRPARRSTGCAPAPPAAPPATRRPRSGASRRRSSRGRAGSGDRSPRSSRRRCAARSRRPVSGRGRPSVRGA